MSQRPSGFLCSVCQRCGGIFASSRTQNSNNKRLQCEVDCKHLEVCVKPMIRAVMAERPRELRGSMWSSAALRIGCLLLLLFMGAGNGRRFALVVREMKKTLIYFQDRRASYAVFLYGDVCVSGKKRNFFFPHFYFLLHKAPIVHFANCLCAIMFCFYDCKLDTWSSIVESDLFHRMIYLACNNSLLFITRLIL